MRLLRNFALLFFTLFFFSAHAQESTRYTIRIGTFVNPKPQQFEQYKEYGFLYAHARANKHYEVRLGEFATKDAAESVANKVRNATGDFVSVFPVIVEGGSPSAVVQIATKQGNRSFDWKPYEAVDKLNVFFEKGQIKIVSGPFADMDAARKQVPKLKEMGYSGAFPKMVNNTLLHPISHFETGADKKPLIPLDFDPKAITEEKKSKQEKASPPPSNKLDSYKEEDRRIDVTAKSVEEKVEKKKRPDIAAKLPDIRGNVKRNSAIMLQKVLKEVGVYNSSLDGYYGKGTETAYEKAYESNRQIQKYRILAEHATSHSSANSGLVQTAINDLWDNTSSSMRVLRRSFDPIAKAYRAYYLFVDEPSDVRINDLMNQAVKSSFADKKVTNFPKFDYSASYNYNNLSQLLTHLGYIHEISDDGFSVPCWMFQKHPDAAQKAFISQGSDIPVQNCGGFWDWETIRVLQAIASDMCLNDNPSDVDHSTMSLMFLAPQKQSADDGKKLNEWNDKLWRGIDGWSLRAPMLEELATALKITYYQSYILLEDHFMDQDYSSSEAKAMSLEVLKALVGKHLERFI